MSDNDLIDDYIDDLAGPVMDDDGSDFDSGNFGNGSQNSRDKPGQVKSGDKSKDGKKAPVGEGRV